MMYIFLFNWFEVPHSRQEKSLGKLEFFHFQVHVFCKEEKNMTLTTLEVCFMGTQMQKRTGNLVKI